MSDSARTPFRTWLAVITRQLAWFAGVGTVMTVAYLAVYAGLRLFVGKASCVNCHNGPRLTDDHFHNTGVPATRTALPPDSGPLSRSFPRFAAAFVS